MTVPVSPVNDVMFEETKRRVSDEDTRRRIDKKGGTKKNQAKKITIILLRTPTTGFFPSKNPFFNLLKDSDKTGS